jgi:ferredoxin
MQGQCHHLFIQLIYGWSYNTKIENTFARGDLAPFTGIYTPEISFYKSIIRGVTGVLKDIEKIGAVMAQFDKTLPTNDCSACILSPKLVEVGRHPNVEILTRTTVNVVEGEPGRFKVKLTKAPRFIDLAKCMGCGDCANVCPASRFPPDSTAI